MAFNIDMSPLERSSMSIGRSLVDIGRTVGGAIQDSRQQSQQQQQQGDIEAFMRQAMDGDPVALEELMIKSPQAAQMVAQHLQQQQAGEKAEADRFTGEIANNTANFIEQMHTAPIDQQEAMFNAAIDDPRYDIDEEDRNLFMDTNARKAAVSQVKGKEYADNFFGGAVDPIKERELDIKQEANDIRRLENKERALDRKLARETNDLKKQQLEDKIAETKKQKGKKINEVRVQGEQAVLGVEDSIIVANELLTHEGLDAAVGGTSLLPSIPGSEASNFEAKLEQFQSKQFMTGIEQMKGMGALSEAEGRKISAAASALNLSLSEDAFRKELGTVIDGLNKGKEFLRRKFGIEAETQQGGGGSTNIAPENQQAYDWAMANQNDPRSAKILAKIGVN
jgi:limonene-1,2-epoxide hydrolase